MLTDLIHFLRPLTEPIGLLWLLLLVAASVLAKKRKWSGALVLLSFAVLISLVGSTGLPARLLASLERPYADTRQSLPPADAVVMLGGTLEPSAHDLLGIDVNATADRVLTSLELMRQRKASVLVLGGSSFQQQDRRIKEADLIRDWLLKWGVTQTPILSLPSAANTRDEALSVKTLMEDQGWNRLLLVTSAYHMKRAEATFLSLEIPVIPVACDFQAVRGPVSDSSWMIFPEIDGFAHLEYYLHEIIGWWVYRWRGWIDPGKTTGPIHAATSKEPADY